MTFVDNFYLSDNITDNRKKIKRRINWNSNILEYYLLAVSKTNSTDAVNIIPALEFKSLPDNKKQDLVIVGVSNGYSHAMKMVAGLARESFEILEISNRNLKSLFTKNNKMVIRA